MSENKITQIDFIESLWYKDLEVNEDLKTYVSNLELDKIDHVKTNFYKTEPDKKLIDLLKKKFQKNNIIEIINEDILNMINSKNFGKKIIVFGNLPYNISTQILASFIQVEKWPLGMKY